MRLYGNDIDETATVLEADSGGLSAGRRTRSSAGTSCSAQKAEGVTRKLVGFEMTDRGDRASRSHGRTTTVSRWAS